ncbi:MAG: hypothetical protein M3336_16365, partial [Chloroflexota bacterium]|nr:hypothetical protein [Chloroflexota bacterium]
LEPPPAGNPKQATALARASAERYGRDAIDVELDLQSALDRIAGPKRSDQPDQVDPEPLSTAVGAPAASGVLVRAEAPSVIDESSSSVDGECNLPSDGEAGESEALE